MILDSGGLSSAFWHDVLNHVHQLGAWSYIILAFLVMVEGPVATLIGAGAAAAGLLEPLFVFAAASTGNLTGDVLWYSLGSLGKVDWLARHGRWLGLNRRAILVMEEKMRENALKIILIAKLTLIFAVPALIAAGIAHVRWRRWFPIDILGEIIWTGTLVSAGYYLGYYAARMERGLQILTSMGGVIVFVTAIAVIRHYGRRWGHQNIRETSPDHP